MALGNGVDPKIMNNVSALVSKGIRAYNDDKYVNAINLFKRAYLPEQIPDAAAASVAFNVATTYMDIDDYQAALTWCNKSLEHSHDYNVAYTRALCYLHLNNVASGLNEYYSRYHKTAADAVSFPKLPLQFLENEIGDGEILRNKKVLILNEQGFGDELMFLRVCERINEVVDHAHIQVYPELYELVLNTIAKKYSNITFFTERILTIEFIKQFDCWTALGSVWAQFVLNGIGKKPISFGKADTIRKNNVRIGFIGSPNKKSKNSKMRTIDINIFKKLAKSPEFSNIEFVNLQYGTNYDWCSNAQIESFYDTYVEMSNVDLVICCDTGAAHLAAAMDINFALVYNGYLDWRWKFPNHYDVQIIQQSKLLEFMKGFISNV